MKEGAYSQQIDFGDMAEPYRDVIDTFEKGTPSPDQHAEQQHENQKAHQERVHQTYTGMPPEEQEEQRRKKQEEENKYRDILFAYHSRPLTTDEWEFLESKPFHKGLFGKLTMEEALRYGNTPNFIEQALTQRATDYLTDYATNRYPSWWEVWDANGKTVSRMSLQDKACLARMRRFASLSPEEKYEEIKQTFPNLFIPKDEIPGDKFAKVIEGFFAFLFSLFRDSECDALPEPQIV